MNSWHLKIRCIFARRKSLKGINEGKMTARPKPGLLEREVASLAPQMLCVYVHVWHSRSIQAALLPRKTVYTEAAKVTCGEIGESLTPECPRADKTQAATSPHSRRGQQSA